jgi:hypothetical protein
MKLGRIDFLKTEKSMPRLCDIAIDTEKTNEGVWAFYRGFGFKIARYANKNYQAFVQQLMKSILPTVRGNNADPEKLEDIDKQAAAKYLLIDWKDLQDETGKDIPYSYEKALEIFRNPEHEDIFRFVTNFSVNVENYRRDIQKDSEKN